MSTCEIEKKHVLINKNGDQYYSEEMPDLFREIITSRNNNEIKWPFASMLELGKLVVKYLSNKQCNYYHEDFVLLLHDFPEWLNHDMQLMWLKVITLEQLEDSRNHIPGRGPDRGRNLRRFHFYKDKVEDLVIEGIEIVRRRRKENILIHY
eukprot:GHVL01007777.1.p1 GENE.GHVL01007777.1~~GHVL01007777.1.p1  ORF type:complete len:151 (-),score=13.53 GHVL01007777.1:623-1075(-)